MDVWVNTASVVSSMRAPTILSTTSTILNYSDPLLSKILAAKKSLQVVLESNLDNESEDKALIELLIASCDGDLVTLESIIRSKPEMINKLYPKESKGVSCLIYAICFGNYGLVESILSNHNADPDLYDTIVYYTPIMWAVYFNQLDIVKLLLNHQADPYLSPKDDEKDAITLANPENIEMYEYFKSHNLLNNSSTAEDDFYGAGYEPQDPLMDDLSAQIKLQSITSDHYKEEEIEEDYDEERELAKDPVISSLNDFEYDKLLPDQYLKFTDSDIPSLLDYIFNLRTNNISYQHDTKIPAAIVFQLIRYSHLKVDSPELTEFLFDCFTTRLRSVTNTKSGVFNMAITDNAASASGAGDIVLLSYWLSVIQYLHFYFSKNDIYLKFPRFLQELINSVQSLVATLSFSINSRLNLLVDDCLLDFTNLVDVSNVLYAKDWNLFKNKNRKHPSTYEDIFNMLYPPSQNELMKPSPIRYIQVLGALDYVLKIHGVDNLLKVQTFSQVFYYINSIIFNRIISQSKYCSRSKAIQIRLNISTLEDWLRSHNYNIYKPDSIGGLNKLLDDTNVVLHNLFSSDSNDTKNPHSLIFYYNSLYHVGKQQLQPTIELLQWLQCMSSLTDEESLIVTINSFESLNYYQLFKVINKMYKYEINEPKIPKKLSNTIKSLVNEQGENQIQSKNLHYMTQTNFLTKELYIYLNPNFIFEVALPNLAELINNYGSGFGGVRVLRSRLYQPSLPIAIIDEIDDLINENKNNNHNDTYDYEDEDLDQYKGKDQLDQLDQRSQTNGFEKEFKGDELFKEIQLPNSLVHKHWGDDDIEANPW